MLKKKLEAVLFASNKPLGLEELGKLCKESDLELVKKSVNELKEDHESRGSSLVIMNNHGYYHVVVHENFIPYVKKLVTKTELSKTIIETLAIVAHKAPAIQSDVVKIRTNKAYDHLRELEELGYIKDDLVFFISFYLVLCRIFIKPSSSHKYCMEVRIKVVLPSKILPSCVFVLNRSCPRYPYLPLS